MLVIENLASDVIIGTNYIMREKVDILTSQGIVRVPNVGDIPFTLTPEDVKQKPYQAGLCARSIDVPARSTLHIKIRGQSYPPDRLCVVEEHPLLKITIPSLKVGSVTTTPDGCRELLVLVTNTGLCFITIPPRFVLAEIYCDEMEILSPAEFYEHHMPMPEDEDGAEYLTEILEGEEDDFFWLPKLYPDLSSGQKKELIKILHKYKGRFTRDESILGWRMKDAWPHRILLKEGAQPVHQYPRRRPPEHNEFLAKHNRSGRSLDGSRIAMDRGLLILSLLSRRTVPSGSALTIVTSTL